MPDLIEVIGSAINIINSANFGVGGMYGRLEVRGNGFCSKPTEEKSARDF